MLRCYCWFGNIDVLQVRQLLQRRKIAYGSSRDAQHLLLVFTCEHLPGSSSFDHLDTKHLLFGVGSETIDRSNDTK